MKAGIGKRIENVESNVDDSNPDKSYADELVINPDEVNLDRSNTVISNPGNQEDTNATVEGEQQQDNSVNNPHQQIRRYKFMRS